MPRKPPKRYVIHNHGFLPWYPPARTVWMHDMHRWNERGLECTHFCHPSAPQTWVVALYRALQGPQPAGTDSSAGAG